MPKKIKLELNHKNRSRNYRKTRLHLWGGRHRKPSVAFSNAWLVEVDFDKIGKIRIFNYSCINEMYSNLASILPLKYQSFVILFVWAFLKPSLFSGIGYHRLLPTVSSLYNHYLWMAAFNLEKHYSGLVRTYWIYHFLILSKLCPITSLGRSIGNGLGRPEHYCRFCE